MPEVHICTCPGRHLRQGHPCKGELVVPFPHLSDRVRQREGVRKEQRSSGNGACRCVRQARRGHSCQLADPQHAGRVVGAITHRVVGVPVLGDQFDGVGRARVLADQDGVGARHHHLVEDALGALQRVAEEGRGVPGQLAQLVGLADEVARLFQGRAVVQFLDGLNADMAQQPVGSTVKDPYDRADQSRTGLPPSLLTPALLARQGSGRTQLRRTARTTIFGLSRHSLRKRAGALPPQPYASTRL